MFYVTVWLRIPLALHCKQGCLMTRPIPLHLSHYKCITMPPLLYTVEPDPPHERHLVGAVPGLHLFPPHEGHELFLSNVNPQ